MRLHGQRLFARFAFGRRKSAVCCDVDETYQFRVVGQRPLELEVAGSRVAVTVHASVAVRAVMRVKRIFAVF